MAAALIVGGLVMWIVDRIYGSRNTETNVTPRRAVWIGLCQTLSAVFPGTSRSMATITAGELAGLSRAAALEFSFLLSIPTMVAATGYDLFKYLRHDGAPGIDSHQLMLLAIGFVVSFFVAWGVVAWFMSWVRERGFVPFAVYRIVVGIAVLIWM